MKDPIITHETAQHPDGGDCAPLPEAVELAALLALNASPEGMAAILSGFLRARDKEREAFMLACTGDMLAMFREIRELKRRAALSETEGQ